MDGADRPQEPCREDWEQPWEAESQQENRASVLQLQGNGFSQQPVSLEEAPERQMRITALAATLTSSWWAPEQVTLLGRPQNSDVQKLRDNKGMF